MQTHTILDFIINVFENSSCATVAAQVEVKVGIINDTTVKLEEIILSKIPSYNISIGKCDQFRFMG